MLDSLFRLNINTKIFVHILFFTIVSQLQQRYDALTLLREVPRTARDGCGSFRTSSKTPRAGGGG